MAQQETTDIMAQFNKIKEYVKKGESLDNEILDKEKEIKNLEIIKGLLMNGTTNETKLMLMLGFNTTETGKVLLKMDNTLYKGLVVGIDETIRINKTELEILKDKFTTLINRN